MNLLQVKRNIPSVEPETIFQIGNFPVRNSTLLIFFITIFLILFSYFAIRKFREKPGSVQSVTEMLFEGIENLISQIISNKTHAKAVSPLIASIFVYIGIANMVAFIPGVTSITIRDIPLFRTPTTDFSTTLGLSLAMVVLIHVISIKDWGVWVYLGKYFQFGGVYRGFKEGIGRGIESIIEFFVGLLDIISEFAKVISLSLRLFGNIYAGEVLAMVFLGAIAYVVPSSWMALNILFAIVQAMVFGSLVAAYYMIARKPEQERSL